MLTLEETLQQQKDLDKLCQYRNESSNFLFWMNEYYGINLILNQYTKRPSENQSKIVLPHGVTSGKMVLLGELTNPLPVISIYPEHRLEIYKYACFYHKINKKLILGTAPFVYVTELLKNFSKPKRQGTIFFPSHSAFLAKAKTNWENLADELVNLPEQYQPVTICIYHNDFRQGNHIPFQNRGLRIVSCGYKTDPLFLFRFYHLCSLHKYSSGNGLGSHVPYSIKAGCQYFHLDTHKASYELSDNCQTESVNFGRLINTQIQAPDLLEDIENLSSNQEQQLQFADYYLGSKYLKSPQETNQLLDEAEYLYRQGVGRVFLPQTQWQSKEIKKNEEIVTKSNVDLVVIYWSGNNKLLNIWSDNVKFLENSQLMIVTDGTNQEKDSIDLLKQFCLSNNIFLIENQEYTDLVQAIIQAKQKFSNYKYAHIFKDSIKLLASPLETIKIASAKGVSFYGVIEKTFWGETYNNYWCLCLNIDLIFEKIKPHYYYKNNYYAITTLLQEIIDYGFNVQKSHILKNIMCEVVIPEQKYCETYWRYPNLAIEDKNVFIQNTPTNNQSQLPKKSDKYVVVVAHVNPNAYSETFIHNHIQYLPAEIINIPGISFPLQQNREQLKQFFLEKQVDAILAEYGRVGVALMDICQELSIPLIVHFHGFDAYSHGELQNSGRYYPSLFQKASATIAVSRHMEQQLLSLGAVKEKLYYNLCGADLSLFQPSQPEKSELTFIAVGRFVDKKAPNLTILAFAQVCYQYPQAKLIMIGEGVLLESCKMLAKSLGIYENIEFTGSLPQSAVAEKMQQARAFVQHSVTSSYGDSEGTPVSLMEASATGIPVIATRHAGIKDVVIEGETGFLVDEGNVDGMAEYMIQLAENPELAQKLGEAGRKRIEQYFSLEQSLNNLWSIIKNSIEKNKAQQLIQKLNLSETNLIIFPDWSNSQEEIGEDLLEVILQLMETPPEKPITLLVDTTGILPENASELFSAISMSLLFEYELDLTEYITISLLGELTDQEWRILCQYITYRMEIKNENKSAIKFFKSNKSN